MFYRECERSARGSVISSVKSNIFEVTGESVLMLYGSHLTGAPTSTLLVLSETPLGDAALEALEKSAASLEFGAAPLARVVVETDEGKLGVMDYYEMKNTIADTAMRDSIASMGEGANAPRKK